MRQLEDCHETSYEYHTVQFCTFRDHSMLYTVWARRSKECDPSSLCPNQLLSPTRSSVSGNREMTTYLRPVAGLRMHGVIPPVPRISSMRSAGLRVGTTSPLHFTNRDVHLRPTNFWDEGNKIS
jgi:hypothetical protein